MLDLDQDRQGKVIARGPNASDLLAPFRDKDANIHSGTIALGIICCTHPGLPGLYLRDCKLLYPVSDLKLIDDLASRGVVLGMLQESLQPYDKDGLPYRVAYKRKPNL